MPDAPIEPSAPPADVTITGTVPTYADDPDDFAINAENTIKQLPAVFAAINAALAWIYATAYQIFNNAGVAEEYANESASYASAAANAAVSVDYQGLWSAQTGAFSVGDAVGHGGVVWRANVNIADVTASEPSDVNGQWIKSTGGIVIENHAMHADDIPLNTTVYLRRDHVDAVALGYPDMGLADTQDVLWVVSAIGVEDHFYQTAFLMWTGDEKKRRKNFLVWEAWSDRF